MSTVSQHIARRTEQFALWASDWSGRSETVIGSVLILLIWAATGPLYHYSDAWQLVINSLTNVVTFVMVFLIQRAQNKSALAVQLKLNEIIAAMRGASNRLIAVEELSEDELRRLHERYQQLVEDTRARGHRHAACSVEAVVDSQAAPPA